MKPLRTFVFAALLTCLASTPGNAGVSVSIRIAPPELPYYEQPVLPDYGYLWIPGYWAYDDDYYWVPGTWARPPRTGLLWTPGYWSWNTGFFIFHPGYWGPHVGYYGGVNYGHGYDGYGYEGGRWDGGQFSYNRAVNNIHVTNVRNTYTTVVNSSTTINRVSYHGGDGGTRARPSDAHRAAERDEHVPATPEQASHEHAARARPESRHSGNKGRPPVVVAPRPANREERIPRPEQRSRPPEQDPPQAPQTPSGKPEGERKERGKGKGKDPHS